MIYGNWPADIYKCPHVLYRLIFFSVFFFCSSFAKPAFRIFNIVITIYPYTLTHRVYIFGEVSIAARSIPSWIYKGYTTILNLFAARIRLRKEEKTNSFYFDVCFFFFFFIEMATGVWEVDLRTIFSVRIDLWPININIFFSFSYFQNGREFQSHYWLQMLNIQLRKHISQSLRYQSIRRLIFSILWCLLVFFFHFYYRHRRKTNEICIYFCFWFDIDYFRCISAMKTNRAIKRITNNNSWNGKMVELRFQMIGENEREIYYIRFKRRKKNVTKDAKIYDGNEPICTI